MTKKPQAFSSRAFSLIELSIVILIIGILIAGITQSSRLVAQSRLSSARGITQSAPPASMRNLVLWYDSTSDASFTDTEEEDAALVTNWFDINPTSTTKINAASSGANRPAYKTNCINGLPCLNFNGTSQFMDTASVGAASTTMTYFVVLLPTAISVADFTAIVMTNGAYTAGNNSLHFQFRNAPDQNKFQYVAANGVQTAFSSAAVSLNTAYILGAVDDAVNVTLYNNGAVALSSLATAVANKTLGVLNIASYFDGGTRARYLGGYIGEIIIFDRNLKTEERRSIEAYLGKKWGIKVS